MRLLFLSLLVCGFAPGHADEDATNEGAQVEKKEPKRPSTLAPVVKYLDMWAALHSKDVGIPKVLLLLDGEADDAPTTPDWFSSAAMHFKKERKKSASFLVVPSGQDAQRAALRFGLAVLPAGGALFACTIGNDGAYAQQYGGTLSGMGGGEMTRAVRAFVQGVVSDGLSADERMSLPTFPEPKRPRKKADVSLEEFTHETLSLRCYGVQAKPLCVLAVVASAAGQGCPSAVAELAKRHANDPVSFGCVGAAKQTSFLAGYGLEGPSALPALLAIKGGKRPRFAKHEGGFEVGPMGEFVDSILGGGAAFRKLAEMPELDAPYLLDDDDGEPAATEEVKEEKEEL